MSSSILTYADLPETGFLRIQQVLRFIPVGKSSWWKGVKEGKYPKPIKLGPRTTAWRAEDIGLLVQQFGIVESDSHDD